MPSDLVIALIGEVDTGKSALVNALVGKPVCRVSARAGETCEIARVKFSHPQWAGGLSVIFIDTPGLSEPDGRDKGQLALDAASESDLAIFVIDGDLSETEYHAIHVLNSHAKPIVVAINKSDTLNRKQKFQVLNKVQERLQGIIQRKFIVECAANPIKHKIRVETSGKEVMASENVSPEVKHLRKIIGDILIQEHENLLLIRDLETLNQRKQNLLRTGNELVENYVMGIAAAVALNPIPIADFLGASAALTGMIIHLHEKLEIQMNSSDVDELVSNLLQSARGLLAGVIFGTFAASILKTIPFIGWVVGAATQAAMAGYASHIIGQTAVVYFASGCSWEGRKAADIMSDIIRNTDKHAVISQIKEKLRDKYQ